MVGCRRVHKLKCLALQSFNTLNIVHLILIASKKQTCLVIVVNFCFILVSCGRLSHWQSYHIFFFILTKTRVHKLKCPVFFIKHWYYVDSPKYKALLQLSHKKLYYNCHIKLTFTKKNKHSNEPWKWGQGQMTYARRGCTANNSSIHQI